MQLASSQHGIQILKQYTVVLGIEIMTRRTYKSIRTNRGVSLPYVVSLSADVPIKMLAWFHSLLRVEGSDISAAVAAHHGRGRLVNVVRIFFILVLFSLSPAMGMTSTDHCGDRTTCVQMARANHEEQDANGLHTRRLRSSTCCQDPTAARRYQHTKRVGIE